MPINDSSDQLDLIGFLVLNYLIMEENKKPINPFAFPFSVAEYGHPAACGGMTLRDHFAGLAMQGYLAASVDLIGHGSAIDSKTIAEEVYIIADAMLKQREL